MALRTVAAAVPLTLVLSLFTASSRRPAVPDRHRRNEAATCRVSVGDTFDGTGVVVSAAGYVVTASSLLEQCDGCAITVCDGGPRGTWRAAQLIGVDKIAGIALLKLDGKVDDAAAPAASTPADGLPVYALTFEVGVGAKRLEGEVRHAYPQAVLTDLPNPPGSLGSGVYGSRDGRLLGILVGTADDPETPERPGSKDLGALIPVSAVRVLLKANNIPF